MPRQVSSWVVQQYIHNPLLLRAGGRKFDMRCWVLVDANYGVHLYRHGVLRVASAAYDPNDVNNRFAHLTNHCIATEHEEYGKFEPTNEVSLRVGTRAMSDAGASATEIHLHKAATTATSLGRAHNLLR